MIYIDHCYFAHSLYKHSVDILVENEIVAQRPMAYCNYPCSTFSFAETFQDNCKTCLASTIISIPLNFLTIYIIYKSQGKAVADGKLCDGAIHLMFLGKEGYQ